MQQIYRRTPMPTYDIAKITFPFENKRFLENPLNINFD